MFSVSFIVIENGILTLSCYYNGCYWRLEYVNFSNKDTELAYQGVYARPLSIKTFLINNQQQIVRKTELDLGLLQHPRWSTL